jgi:hypothetical protein
MKNIKGYIIPAVLISVLCIYLWFYNPDKTNYNLPDMNVILKKDISKIEIVKTGLNLTLKKKDDSWQIDPEGYLADSDKIQGMTDTIEKLSLTALVSESGNYNRYGLEDDSKIAVKAFNETSKKIREFEIGKAASSSENTFIKVDNDPRVYHAKGNLRSKFDYTADQLRDTSVLSFNVSDIAEIDIHKDKQDLVLIRKQVPVESTSDKTDSIQETGIQKTKDQWQTTDNQVCDEEKIDLLLRTLSALKCDTFIHGKEKEDFQSPIYTVLLEGPKEYRLSIFGKINDDHKTYPAISSENKFVFYLSDYQVDKIMSFNQVKNE